MIVNFRIKGETMGLYNHVVFEALSPLGKCSFPKRISHETAGRWGIDLDWRHGRPVLQATFAVASGTLCDPTNITVVATRDDSAYKRIVGEGRVAFLCDNVASTEWKHTSGHDFRVRADGIEEAYGVDASRLRQITAQMLPD